jgi:hypothetical protein
VFVGPQSLVDKGDWIDRPSVGIPALYVSTGFLLNDALSSLGDTASAGRVMRMTERVAAATRLSDLLEANRAFLERSRLQDSEAALPLPAPPADTGRRP